jgi:hypothetical protein
MVYEDFFGLEGLAIELRSLPIQIAKGQDCRFHRMRFEVRFSLNANISFCSFRFD